MDRYYPLDITVSASTPPGSPLTHKIVLEDKLLVDVEIIIPPGHVALTGIRVLSSNQQVIPWGNNSWITADDYVRVFTYNDFIGANAISVQVYNTDIISHTFYIKFHIADLVTIGEGTPSAIVGGIGTVIGTGTGATGTTVGAPSGTPPPPLPPPPPVGVPVPPGLPGSTTTTTPANQQQYFTLV